MKKLFLAVLVVAIGCSEDEPAPPVADFEFTGDNRFAPAKVTFTNLSDNATLYDWQFGDGSSSIGESPSHIYEEGGTYTVVLRVKNFESDVEVLSSKTLTIKNKPNTFRIDQITVTALPFDNNGSNWDLLNGPDVFFEIGTFQSNYFENVVTSNLPLVFSSNAGFPITINDFVSDFNVDLYDYDDLPPNQFMGGYLFSVNDQIPDDGGDYPITLLFGTSSSNIQFKMDVTWL